jgi:outer membrane lipoprotein-sorting protein
MVSVSAQYKDATTRQRDEIVSKITRVAGEMNTMRGDFVQVRELSFMDDKVVSEGRVAFKKMNRIRWEYTKPFKYVFSMDGQHVRITSGDKTDKAPVRSNKLFGEIGKVMAGGVSGKGLVDSPDFDARFMEGLDDYKIVLTPKKKELKELFASVLLFIGKEDCRIRSVELVEKSGDRTVITLKNVQVNVAVEDSLFTE